MTESLTDRIRHYILDGSDRDLSRLLSIAEVLSEPSRAAVRRLGDVTGWRAVECGCGPLGCLALLAELVGPAGTVLGIDFSDATVERARSVLARLGIENVEVVAGDVHDFDITEAGGPVDLAVTRCFLMHQADPARTLGRIAAMLRPGGFLIAQEPLPTPLPWSYPPVGAVPRHWELVHAAAARSGVAPDGIERLPELAARAGFEVVSQSGYFTVMEPAVGFTIHAGSTAAIRDRAVGTGAATAAEVDEVERSLRRAAATEHGWVAGPCMLDLTLRKA